MEGPHPKSTGTLARMAIGSWGICGIKIAIKWIRNNAVKHDKNNTAPWTLFFPTFWKCLAPGATRGVGSTILFLQSPATSSCTSTQRWTHMGALPVHRASEYGQPQHLVALWTFPRTETHFLLAGDPTCSSHISEPAESWTQSLLGGRSSPQEWEHGHPNSSPPASCPNPESTAPPFPHVQHIHSPDTSEVQLETVLQLRSDYNYFCNRNGERESSLS